MAIAELVPDDSRTPEGSSRLLPPPFHAGSPLGVVRVYEAGACAGGGGGRGGGAARNDSSGVGSCRCSDVTIKGDGCGGTAKEFVSFPAPNSNWLLLLAHVGMFIFGFLLRAAPPF